MNLQSAYKRALAHLNRANEILSPQHGMEFGSVPVPIYTGGTGCSFKACDKHKPCDECKLRARYDDKRCKGGCVRQQSIDLAIKNYKKFRAHAAHDSRNEVRQDMAREQDQRRRQAAVEHHQAKKRAVLSTAERESPKKKEAERKKEKVSANGAIGFIKTKNLKISRQVTVVSYNISFAAALEEAQGSEAQFVNDFCAKGSGQCRYNAMNSVAKMKPDVLCLQEYRPWNNVKKKMLAGEFEKVQFDIYGSDDISNELTMQDLFGPNVNVKGSWVAMHSSNAFNFYEGIATIWDVSVMGHMQCQTCINLANTKQDVRPCLITMLSRGALIINCHAPQPENYTIQSFTKKVDEAIASMRNTNTFQIATIVLCGDFNDRKNMFKDGVTIDGMKVHAPEKVISCCYDPGYGSIDGFYQFQGDYIMSSAPVSNTRIFDHQGREQTTPVQLKAGTPGRSDHEPVVAEVSLTLNR